MKKEVKTETTPKEVRVLKKRISELEKRQVELILYYENELNQVHAKRFLLNCKRYISNNGLGKAIKSGFKTLGFLISRGLKFIIKRTKRPGNNKSLDSILKSNKNKKIIVFYPGYDWYMKMYQRPQHMAIHLAEQGYLYFYCTININDNVSGFEKIAKNLYVTNEWELLKKKLSKYNLIVYANMNECLLPELTQIIEEGNTVLYEYIDDLHDDLTKISRDLKERHKYVLENDSIPVLCTASHLQEKALKYREKNIFLSSNGVLYNDFHITKDMPIPEKMKKMVGQGKPIIGYYGALASWFDYDLIAEIAKKRKDYNILLIGIDYDQTLEKYNYFKDFPNVEYIGIVPYKELINYGAYCDVLTIPFVINEITLSTSPVKVFEYMAMEKPIVTTDLPECRKYKSVLISKNHQEFIENIDKSLNSLKNDNEYKKLLKKEALENTWESKAKEVVNILKGAKK